MGSFTKKMLKMIGVKKKGNKKVSVPTSHLCRAMASPPSSPITSKTRPRNKQDKAAEQDRRNRKGGRKKPEFLQCRESIDDEVLSPAKWRHNPETGSLTKQPSNYNIESAVVPALPRGDPLGVLYSLLEEDSEVFIFMQQLPKKVPIKFTRRKPILPKKARGMPKNTLVLDLDETLVHCTTELKQGTRKSDETFTVNFNNIDYTVYMNKRPYLEHFLQTVSKWFEIIVFTASQKCYADTLLDKLDPTGTLIQHRVFRESCAFYMDNFLKPLGILNRDLNSTFIIDNSPQVFTFELENGIPCTSWFEDPKDNELMRLIPYLREMKDMDDVRPYIGKTFGSREFLDSLLI